MKYEVQDAILKVRSTKYEVQGAKYEVLSTRYDVRGAECDDIGLGGLSYATEIQEGPRYGMHWQVRIPSLGSFLYKNLFYIMNIIKTAIEGVDGFPTGIAHLWKPEGVVLCPESNVS